VEDAIEETIEGVGEVVEDITNPLMGSINVVRATLCVARPDIFSHDECLDFMLEYCTRARSIEGPCNKFWVLLGGGCSTHEVDVEHCCQDEAGEENCRHRRGEETSTTFTTVTTTITDPVATTTVPVTTVTTTVTDPIATTVTVTTVTSTTTLPTMEASSPASASVGGLDKRLRPLPEQGYDEHSDVNVEHENIWTASSDWRKEWPRHGADASEEEICKQHPENSWCKLLLGKLQAEKDVLEKRCWFSGGFWAWFWSFF
jgi:hypothetical protein